MQFVHDLIEALSLNPIVRALDIELGLRQQDPSLLSSEASCYGALDLANTSRPDGSCILRHCAGVTPMWILKARWKAASD